MKKRLSVLLGIIMLASLLSGCSQGAAPASPAPAQSSVATPAETSKQEPGTTKSEDAWKPTRPVSIVCWAGAGGPTDLSNRAIAKELEKEMGVSFQVVNMTGGSGGIAANNVWAQKHDGYTLLGLSETVHGIAVIGAFDKTSEAWDSMVIMGCQAVLSVPYDSPYKTLEDLVKAGQTKTLKVGASQASSVWNVKAMQVETATGIKVNHLPYEGSRPTIVALLSNEIDFAVCELAGMNEYYSSNKLRPLAIIDHKGVDLEGYGKIPSISETYPKFDELPDAIQWTGIALPSDTPENIKNAYHDAFAKAVKGEAVTSLAGDLGFNILGIYGEESKEYCRKLDSVYSWILYENGTAKKSPEEFKIPKP